MYLKSHKCVQKNIQSFNLIISNADSEHRFGNVKAHTVFDKIEQMVHIHFGIENMKMQAKK